MTPQEIVEFLSREYKIPPWRPRGDPLAELILTILSQNTSDTNSGRAFDRLLAAFPSWKAMLTAPQEALAQAIQVGGLARIKAARIQAILAEVQRRVEGFDLAFLAKMPLAEAKAWLRSLPGVGPKTAACVLLFSLGRPALPVDTHVFRVSRRLGLLPPRATPDQAHDILEGLLAPHEVWPFHIGLVRHGRRVCRAQHPLCPACPLRHGCPSAALPTAARDTPQRDSP